MQYEIDTDDDEPEPFDLWVMYCDPDEKDRSQRLGIAEVTGYGHINGHRDIRLLYDSIPEVETPTEMDDVPPRCFYAPLDTDRFDRRFEDLLDYHLGFLTKQEVAEMLDGEPSHRTDGRRGYEALEFAAFEGVREAITENSISQGHGPTRYGKTVRQYLRNHPTWMQSRIIEGEFERWTGGLEFTDEQAWMHIELLELREEFLNADHGDDIHELVNDYDLEYDKYDDEYPGGYEPAEEVN